MGERINRNMQQIDPYRQLAVKLLFKLKKGELKAIKEGDTKIITNLLKAECRDLDWTGPILDTIWAAMYSIPDARWLRMRTEAVGKELIKCFDFEKLREHLTSLAPNL